MQSCFKRLARPLLASLTSLLLAHAACNPVDLVPEPAPSDDSNAADPQDAGDTGVPGGTPDDRSADMTSGDTTGPNDAAGGDPATLATLQVFPPDNPWNQNISALPVHPNSAAYIASIGLTRGLHPDFGTVWEGAPIGIPFIVVPADQPKLPVAFLYDDESDIGPYPIPPDPPIEGGPLSQGDRHILMVDPVKKLLYELYAAYPPGWDAHGLGMPDVWTAGSGAVFDLTSNDLRPAGWTSADAAGLPVFAGLVRYDEVVERGEIRHALRFTTSRTQRAYISPATHWASSSTDPNRPPMGLRVRLKASFDTTPFSKNVRVILEAMKTYGMFVADNGSDWYISGAPDPRWDDDELHELGDVHGSDFEAVYTGEIVTP